MNPTTYNLARINMILHGVHSQRFDLRNEDTLEHPTPEHADLRFDAIVANPSFSANWSASAIHENDDRFSAYGKLAPKDQGRLRLRAAHGSSRGSRDTAGSL